MTEEKITVGNGVYAPHQVCPVCGVTFGLPPGLVVGSAPSGAPCGALCSDCALLFSRAIKRLIDKEREGE